jgi:hypothetical protein
MEQVGHRYVLEEEPIGARRIGELGKLVIGGREVAGLNTFASFSLQDASVESRESGLGQIALSCL